MDGDTAPAFPCVAGTELGKGLKTPDTPLTIFSLYVPLPIYRRQEGGKGTKYR